MQLPRVAAILVLLLAVPAAAQPLADHLKCYKMRDPLKVAGTADLDTPQFGLDPGCRLTGAAVFCVPATKTNVAVVDKSTNQPITPQPVDGPDPGDRICYKVKCEQAVPDQQVTDQFGARTVRRLKATMVCTPAVKPSCTPNFTRSCYQGPPGTENVGPCHGGTQTCAADGLSWGPCVGQVLPRGEICGNGVDEDCTGTADEVQDIDGDGWTACDGDCCDSLLDCTNPQLVNPGAFEVGGNLVDDDCDGTIDNPLGPCDAGLASNSSTALDYAKAIDLCQTTTDNPPTLAQKRWGVISAELLRADGAGTPATNSRSIRSGFGGNVLPLNGISIAVLSTGNAAAPGQTNPPHASFQPGQDMATSSAAPADWLAVNGGTFPNAPGCPSPTGGTVNDPVMLKVRVRVPTNAKSFSVGTYSYSAEYPEWVCSAFNDFFLTLLDSTFVPMMPEVPNPADKNLAFYDLPPIGGPVYPVGVNLAFGETGLFQQCKNGPTGCAPGAVAGTTSACTSTTQLVGTGFDVANPEGSAGIPGFCDANNLLGGGTGWLVTSGNVKPGETIEVRFVIWDTSDHLYDSVVLLDNWAWSAATADPGTHN